MDCGYCISLGFYMEHNFAFHIKELITTKIKVKIDTTNATSEMLGFFTFVPPFLYFVHSYNSTPYNLCQ